MIHLAKHGNKTIRAMKDMTSSPRVDEGRTYSKKDGLQNAKLSSSSNSNAIENVLILQGGGSLGAFGCGVFKALAEKNMKIDIVAGTSIGGVNAAIIAGGKNEGRPEQLLEEFWLELTDKLRRFREHSYSFYISAVGTDDIELLFLLYFIARRKEK